MGRGRKDLPRGAKNHPLQNYETTGWAAVPVPDLQDNIRELPVPAQAVGEVAAQARRREPDAGPPIRER